jgi:PiT family inorganic phosphate transporter
LGQVGFATQAGITWRWESGSISQVAASWGIAPAIAACFSAIVFGSLKYSVLERKDSFKWAMRLIPFYLAGTAAILALFLAVEMPSAPDLADVAGEIAGSILAVFFGVLIIGYVFFIPFFKAKLVNEDPRIKFWHLPLGPLLLRENPPLYWPGKGEEFVTNYYEDAYGNVQAGKKDEGRMHEININEKTVGSENGTPDTSIRDAKNGELSPDDGQVLQAAQNTTAMQAHRKNYVTPYDRFITPVKGYSWVNPLKWWGYFKFALLRGVFMDVITHDSALLREIHAKAHRYDVRVEHMWTYCQVISAMMMSIAHGSNDVANAVGPWAGTYTYR